MNIINIKDAEPEQARFISDIESKCFSDPWTIGQILNCMADGGIFLAAVEGDEVIGYISVACVLDEGHIGNVAVAPEHRRRGAAEALVRAAVERGRERGLSFLTLEVRAGNEAAIALYEKCGFSRVGLRRGYYYNPKEDAVLMTRLGLETN